MPFEQYQQPLDTSVLPTSKQVVLWLWQVEKAKSPLVRKHGQEMLNNYFDTKEAAELFILHGE